MKRNISIILLALVLFLGNCYLLGAAAKLKIENEKLQIQIAAPALELKALKEIYNIGPGFYSITSQEMSEFIWFLAGPDCEGRQSGTEGNNRAGQFLMGELESYFIDSRFFQEFEQDKIKNLRNGDVAPYLKVRTIGRNVVGVLEGTEKKKEYVVISAHYDHLGISRNGKVYPGADDNASGTAAVLEIAEAFGILAKEGIRPERSIVFAFFDAEEMGLWGSQYFVENPPFPFEDMVAVINLDMVGRNESDKLEVVGLNGSPQLLQAMTEANTILKFELISDWSLFDFSDQASFFYASPKGNRLPVVFYHSGYDADYHTPGDTAEKINFEKVQNIARFTFFVAWLVSNLEERPVDQFSSIGQGGKR